MPGAGGSVDSANQTIENINHDQIININMKLKYPQNKCFFVFVCESHVIRTIRTRDSLIEIWLLIWWVNEAKDEADDMWQQIEDGNMWGGD